MDIDVVSVSTGNSPWAIRFRSQYGNGHGIWRSELPSEGQRYKVELDVRQPIKIGVNAQISSKQSPQIRSSHDCIDLIAMLENVFENDTASLRLGESIILVDFEGDLPPVGTWVQVTLPGIELYDSHA